MVDRQCVGQHVTRRQLVIDRCRGVLPMVGHRVVDVLVGRRDEGRCGVVAVAVVDADAKTLIRDDAGGDE